ncbi:hypothetical protein BDY19DRAFT_964983 [Irpex rosettiformis]|uniref:Uncharacterized protein n=1 Tax=Irpex rosettiformis TaxID=378272 RepID=A0ACB8TUP4_9APHY|nr:hypothetical protein BDY19DRAFT_964983 [Irpex rosettiformis]
MQVALEGFGHVLPPQNSAEGTQDSLWAHDSMFLLGLPLYASVLSFAVLFAQWLVDIVKNKRRNFDSEVYDDSTKHGRDPNERKIFVFRLVRLIAFVVVTSLSIYTTYDGNNSSHASWLLSGVVQTLAYLIFLSKLCLSKPFKGLSYVRAHLTFISLLMWSVFAYRDLWPLATFTLSPVDHAEGWLMWAKIFLLTLAAIVIPLTIPRSFTPVDPNRGINPEQTASILSAAFFGWLSPYIWLGNKVEHLAWDQLPPLAEYDYTEEVVRRGMKYVDPILVSNKKHLFFRIIRVFWKDWVVIAIVLVIEVFASLALPIGIFRLLNYLSGDRTDFVRPWFWILWMAVGPIIESVAIQWYRFTNTRVIVLVQALLIQAIFNHALRSRVKADTQQPSSSSDDSAPGKASSGNFAGKLNNLITTDMINVIDGVGFLYPFLYLPLQLALCSWFLYSILGWSAFLGMSIIFITLPIPTRMVRHIQGAQVEKMKRTDARVQLVTEIMNVIRMIKLFAWEPHMNAKLAEKRKDELQYQKRVSILELIYKNINFAIPVFTMIATFASYTLVMKQELTASRVFSAMSVFEVLRGSLEMILGLIPTLIRAKVSLDRTNDFFLHTELLDQYDDTAPNLENHSIPTTVGDVDPETVGIREASFTWDNEERSLGNGQRNFTLRITDEVVFKRGAINLIMGPTGSGKTSLLMALLGEMHYTPTGPNSYVQLPRVGGGLAYAAQESWVLNATIRDNIVFGASFDEARYDAILDQCALKRDLELFEAGDMTEVGERGVTLSGGQKARVTLARAVYSKAEIVLLDDVLAALDVHTSKWIVERCLKGDLIKGRTVLLATHNIRLVQPVVEFVVSLGTDGCIADQGSTSSVLSAIEEEKEERQADKLNTTLEEEEVLDTIDETPTATISNLAVKPSSDGKLIVAEEISRGRVPWSAMKLYFTSMGGQHPVLYWVTFLGGVFLVRFIQSIQAWYLGYWSEQYEKKDPSEINPLKYLTVYSLMLISGIILYFAAYLIFVYGCLRASRTIHENLVLSVLGTTLRWLDTTPISRVITRCTQDISTIDGPITYYLTRIVELTISMIIKFTAVVVISPMFIIPGILLSVLGGWYGKIYLKPQLAVKREMSNARAPVLSHFSAAFSGLVSIRAYGAQEGFRIESYERLDKNTRTARTSFNFNRWISLRIEVLAGLFAAGLAAYLVYDGAASAANAGFSLTMAVGFNGLILWWVRMWSEFEVRANSLERIQQYLKIEQEPKKTSEGVPPAYWPSSGELVVKNLSAKYSSDGPDVLCNVSFSVKAGEHIGIVGRTGSGKSSLTLALLRSIITEGDILYDDVSINSINLDVLRSSITIIPQSPELLAGTLRENLDPFSQYDDAVLNDALRASGLFSIQQIGQNSEISLDTHIASGGNNLSTGQRQIIALARALVRQSKLLILDEATSAIDNETDGVIQTSLRSELGKDVTLLTVAHRLRTIMDADKILVLDAGSVVEYDTPAKLLRRETSIFKALVNESRDRAELYALLKE